MDFSLYIHLFCPSWSYQDRVTKLALGILMENCEHSICSDQSFLYLYTPAQNA